jgi:hypothetical protein
MELKHIVECFIYSKSLKHYFFTTFVFKKVGLDIIKNGEQSATSLIRNSVTIGTFDGLHGRNSYIVGWSAHNIKK